MTKQTYEEVIQTQFSQEFVDHMKNAMVVSYYKYGDVRAAFPQRVQAIASLQQRLRKYAETGNKEYLVDAANFAMIEYMCPAHPQAHFKAEDSASSPGRISALTGRPTHEDNKGANLEGGFDNVSSVANIRARLAQDGYGGDN